MDWQGHALLGWRAYGMLPEWEKRLIKPDLSEKALARPYLPPGIRTAGEKMAAMCLIMDWVYFDECRPYATLPDGRWIPHTPADRNFASASGTGLPLSSLTTATLIETLLNKMIEAIRSDDWEEAIRHGGTLGHFLQEPFTPGHAMDNSVFHELFPDPDPQRHIRLHHHFDCASSMFPDKPPVLLGFDANEAAFRLLLEIHRGIKDAKKLVLPVIMSVYQGLPQKVREAILAGQSGRAAHITACAWHTAISIAKNRFDEAEKAALSSVKLTEMVPYFWHACQYVEMTPGNLVQNGRKIPIHIWTRDAAGNRSETLIGDGFGMGGHMGVKFFVNGTLFRRFSCQIALPSRHTEGQGEHTNTVFSVEIDQQENTTYSEDIEYKAQRIFATRLIPGAPAVPVNVDLAGANTLILSARSTSYKDASGNIAWSIPHIAIANPLLSKN